MKTLFGDLPLRIVGLAVVFCLVVLVVITIDILLVPFVAALFLAYLLEPGIIALQRRGMDRGNAFLVLLSCFVLGLAILVMFGPS
jgi:predicted PurR-regulated permease PerM